MLPFAAHFGVALPLFCFIFGADAIFFCVQFKKKIHEKKNVHPSEEAKEQKAERTQKEEVSIE